MIAVSALLLLGCFGCASDEPAQEMAQEDRSHPAGIAHDPVSTVEVRTDTPWKTTWMGDWYYFESEANLRKFDANPDAYLQQNGRARPQRRKVYPHQVQ